MSRAGALIAKTRKRPAFNSAMTLAAVTAQTSALPAITSATQSSALSNTRMTGALTSPPTCLINFASGDVIGIAERGRQRDRDAGRVAPQAGEQIAAGFAKAKSARTANAIYSVTSVAIGV